MCPCCLPRRLGQAVHRVLEWTGGSAGGAPVASLAVAAAAEFRLGAAQARQVEKIAERVLASPVLARFFADLVPRDMAPALELLRVVNTAQVRGTQVAIAMVG